MTRDIHTPDAFPPADLLAPLALFRGLTPEERAAILARMKPRDIIRGESLVVEGDSSESMFIVLHGAFDVIREDAPAPITQIRAGEVIGEIGFFAHTPRTATVTATRDATVLELDRAAYREVAAEVPAVTESLLAVVSRRLGETSARLARPVRRTTERTVAIVPGGREPVPPVFHERLRRVLGGSGVRVIDRETIASRFGADESPDSPAVTHWLNTLEWEDGSLVYIAEPELTDWTRKCVRQADVVLIVTVGDAPGAELSPIERFVAEIHAPDSRRLVRVHERRSGVVSGTPAWLSRMEVFAHHHVALEDDEDFHALVRFISGRALGFVAGGGGAYGPAHVGIYKAFVKRGVDFDVFIGTSVGAAMLAGFAMGYDADHLDRGTHDIFVASRSFKQWNVPRYALLDHTVFDEALKRAYGADTLIEDCWRPFLAVSTNVSTQTLELIRTGLLWKAVRASSAIPALLPPVYTDDGMMLVDGGVMDNVPVVPLRDVKTGPNLVVHFGKAAPHKFSCRYEDIPGRWELIRMLLKPFGRRLPRAPGAADVLMRSLFVHQQYEIPLEQYDLMLRPPKFRGSTFLNFDRHEEVFQASYEWALEKIDELAAEGDVALAALMEDARRKGLASS